MKMCTGTLTLHQKVMGNSETISTSITQQPHPYLKFKELLHFLLVKYHRQNKAKLGTRSLPGPENSLKPVKTLDSNYLIIKPSNVK